MHRKQWFWSDVRWNVCTEYGFILRAMSLWSGTASDGFIISYAMKYWTIFQACHQCHTFAYPPKKTSDKSQWKFIPDSWRHVSHNHKPMSGITLFAVKVGHIDWLYLIPTSFIHPLTESLRCTSGCFSHCHLTPLIKSLHLGDMIMQRKEIRDYYGSGWVQGLRL